MSRFLKSTITDMRYGRESWRVFAVLTGTAFFVAVATTLLRLS